MGQVRVNLTENSHLYFEVIEYELNPREDIDFTNPNFGNLFEPPIQGTIQYYDFIYEIKEWFIENNIKNWNIISVGYLPTIYIEFENVNDALLFKLKWL